MGQVVRSKMAQAMIDALHKRIEEGGNPGHIGAIILTQEAKGTGLIRGRAPMRNIPAKRGQQ